MLTFHPAASLLANFNNTVSTISMTRLFIYILAVLIKTKTNVYHGIGAASQLTLFGDSTVNTKSTRKSYTREFKSGGSKISTFHPAASSLVNFNIGGVVNFAFLVKRMFGKKRMWCIRVYH